jgi:hypothetical protein
VFEWRRHAGMATAIRRPTTGTIATAHRTEYDVK